MMYDDHEFVLVDCTNCPYPHKNLPASPNHATECRHCPHITEDYDRLRLKTKYFTKEYDKEGRLISIEPFFVDVRFMPLAKNIKLVDQYKTKTGAKVYIYEKTDGVGYLYFMRIPEMDKTIEEIKKLYSEAQVFFDTGKTKDPILKRWYLEYGILEHLFFDDKVLEINVNPPGYRTAMKIIHADYDECTSNIFPSNECLDYMATRLKISTGRPLNKAQPQLDGEIIIEEQRSRVAAIVSPFSIFGTGYSIRKHREKPWTLPLFQKNKTVNPWFSGLMSFAITHGRSFLCAGPRGSGKSSLLGSLLLEILPKYRMITIEDTQELPIGEYKSLGYDILPLKVRSALSKGGFEIPFDTGLRTSLRLGDSCLIIGEIRSKEATVLYEAMRVGAMANVVAGTIHGDSPYGVFDRVVNDLGVPPGSFKVTDLIIIVNQIKLPGGLKRKRRVLSVTEVLKDWKDEPKFQDLLVWDPEKDDLVPTQEFLNGKSVLLNQVLKVARGYKDYNHLLEDIKLRAWAKTTHVKLARHDEQFEARYVSPINGTFAKLFNSILPLDSKENMQKFQHEFHSYTNNLFRRGLGKKTVAQQNTARLHQIEQYAKKKAEEMDHGHMVNKNTAGIFGTQ